MGKLLLLFILVPLVDAWLLFQIADLIGGLLNTIALVVFTGIVGAWLFKIEGRRTWGLWQKSLAEGRVPEEGVLGGVMLLLGGALLVTPGVITDAIGLLLLLPPTRRLLADVLRPRLKRYIKERATTVVESSTFEVRFGPEVVVDDTGPSVQPPMRDALPGDAVRENTVRRGRPREIIDADFEVKPE